MKVIRDGDRICIDLSPAEACVFLDELSDVPGGTRLPKLRQVCAAISTVLARPAVDTRSNLLMFGKVRRPSLVRPEKKST